MIKIICVGKIKEKFYVEAINEYKKRLTKYTKIEIIEVPDEQNNSLIKEKENILKVLNLKDYIVTLEREGKKMTSETFSQFIDKTQIINPNITFIIGGSSGLHDEIKKISNYKISFSDMTLIIVTIVLITAHDELQRSACTQRFR